MTASIGRFPICFAIGLLLTGVITCLCVTPATAQDHRQLDRQLRAIEERLSDPLAGESEHRDAQRQLRALLQRVNAAAEGNVDDESHPIHSVHARVIKSLAGVTARLPSERAAAERATGFPVPNYDDGKLLAELAGEVRSAQAALAKAISQSPKDAELLNQLLVNLVLAEENLAWEAGWPFDKKEAEAFKKADQLTSEVYLSRRGRGVEQVNRQLLAEADTTGRGTSVRQFVIHAPVNRDAVAAVSNSLAKLRGKATEDWQKGTRPFDAKESATLFGGTPTSR